jgi:uncharacterized protein
MNLLRFLHLPRPLLLLLLLALCACGESKQLPPGNWQGRCEPSPAGTPVNYGPPATTFVSDKPKALTPAFAEELQRTLSAYQRETCHQVTVVVVGSLDGSTIEEYSKQYANRVGLGYRGLNNGVMLLFAPNTRQARLQIGCGLEDVISDQQATQIMQRDLLPSLSDGDPERGVRVAVEAIKALAKKKTIAKSFRPDGCK